MIWSPTSLVFSTVLFMVLSFGCIQFAQAQGTTYQWNTTSAYWHNTSAWSPNGVPTSADKAVFPGGGGNVYWDQNTGHQAVNELEFLSGNFTFTNNDTNPWSLSIVGTGVPLTLTGSSAKVYVDNLAFDVTNGSMQVNDDASFNLLAGQNSALFVRDHIYNSGLMTFNSQSEVFVGHENYVGYQDHGIQNILGATVSNDNGHVAYGSSATGNVLVSGSGSVWQNRSSLEIGSHSTSNGQVDVENGGFLGVGTYSSGLGVYGVIISGTNDPELFINGGTLNNEKSAIMGIATSHGGSATVMGSNSQWNIENSCTLGSFGQGALSIEDGGQVSASQVTLGLFTSGSGSILVDGSGSQLNVTNYDLVIGETGQGDLTISNNGLVTVADETIIGTNGSVNLNGGRFEFGTMSLSHFNAVTGTNGSMKGTVNHSSYTNAASLQSFVGSQFDLSDVTLANNGTLFGNASLQGSVENKSGGELETLAGERLRFSGNGSNAGEFNNFGGQLRFEGEVYNAVNAVITGRGQFIANGGWTNDGVMAFSGGTTDVVGDVDNSGNGQIVTSGNSTTTFYDDVVHNGLEIRTGEGSNTVFFGSVSGAGNYTGTGTVFFEGDLRPGNSPDVVSFEGNVTIGSTASTLLEIAGQQLGEFDRLEIAGDLDLSGELQVWLSGGFELTPNQQFEVLDVAGLREGTFANFGEGDLVGTFGGQELFITYSAGDGNDVALFTAIPEPNAVAVMIGMSLALFVRRRKHKSR